MLPEIEIALPGKLGGLNRNYNMAKKKVRSVFWVVSTHVLTTGFAMPAVAGMTGLAVLTGRPPSPVAAFLILLAFQACGYIGGVFYSLSYLRTVALIKDPVACVKPSIITFAVLAVIGFAVNVAGLVARPRHDINLIAGIIGLVALYSVICFAFAKITQQGFSRMEPQTTESD
jgi:hypothetical protein